MADRTAYDSSTSEALVSAFTAMNDRLAAARATVAAGNDELDEAYRANSGEVFKAGLDEINAGIARVGNALQILQDGMRRAGAINTNTEQANRSVAAQVGLASSGQSSWT
ncbi:hypothetical protein AB0J86_33445 [Micromonospora sp. NPDC049559]|uniref:hypothetical protein n=1 Tax=Micromonospora sp. NPDC049559 TaxID=3155923 RepID=UPI003419630D